MVRSFLPGALISVAFDPPWPPSPWQAWHFWAKIAAPCCGVPLPGGNPLPSGPTLMSHSARSASLTGLPRPGSSAAIAAAPESASANAAAKVKRVPIEWIGTRSAFLHWRMSFFGKPGSTFPGQALAVDMLDLPFLIDRPAGDDVHVPHREGGHRHVDLGRAALGEHLLAGGLYVAGLVPGAALQHHRLPVPAPGQTEAGQRLGQDRRVERRLRPALAAVGRDQDLLDAAIAGISKAGNLVHA